ncbi:glycerate kinase [Roseibacillus persicicus]|uniref:glycerate kinase n=1 Tax=Roseibacillus persicicus TaxID=454148 RepID=UPI00280E44EF|nr:glycerate kinase [Roseibacillus persicicus]MDQ8192230.1 glycerate kinase [Roseibacillus persicicus]
MNILIACDKFKGSLSAREVALAIEKGLGEGHQIELCPIADGGEGFVDAMLAALGGEVRTCHVLDALGREVEASYGISSSTAIIEMADASGLWRIAEAERDVLRASTYGTGQLIDDGIAQGATKILLGVGGSATNDGGVGMAAALGWLFRDEADDVLEANPVDLADLATVDGSQVSTLPPIEVACDVENPLLGERGATAVYGPQKGAGPAEREYLEAYLEHLMAVCGGEKAAEVPGAGAAGGLAWGLMTFANATLRPGFDIVADAVSLQERVSQADVVITGEGSLDAQSLEGKGPVGVARLAKEMGKHTVAVAGHISDEVKESDLFDQTFALTDTGLPLERLIAEASSLIEVEAGKIRF